MTMKAQTLANRLSKIEIAKSSNHYKAMIKVINGATIIRTCHASGNGRFTTNIDCTSWFVQLCNQLKLKIETGNDSPRGGLCGNYVKILTKIL